MTEPFELTGGMGVGVDADVAPETDGQAQQVVGRVLPLRARVDLDRRSGPGTRLENRLGVESREGSRPLPVMRRPVQWPRMSLWGLSMACNHAPRSSRAPPS